MESRPNVTDFCLLIDVKWASGTFVLQSFL